MTTRRFGNLVGQKYNFQIGGTSWAQPRPGLSKPVEYPLSNEALDKDAAKQWYVVVPRLIESRLIELAIGWSTEVNYVGCPKIGEAQWRLWMNWGSYTKIRIRVNRKTKEFFTQLTNVPNNSTFSN